MTRYKYRPGFSFENGREYTLGEILECFSPIDEPQEIEKLEQDFINDRWDYKPEEFGEKINEIIDMLNSMRKGER